jgi:hypothetical protein
MLWIVASLPMWFCAVVCSMLAFGAFRVFYDMIGEDVIDVRSAHFALVRTGLLALSSTAFACLAIKVAGGL